jgi:hypothetical protein
MILCSRRLLQLLTIGGGFEWTPYYECYVILSLLGAETLSVRLPMLAPLNGIIRGAEIAPS